MAPDYRKYAPAFTEADDRAAREAGYEDAADRWNARMEYESFVHYHESVRARARAQARMDLESVGAPPEKLGRLAEAASRLPAPPEYQAPDRVAVPRDPYTRRAALTGVRNRVVRLLGRLEEEGIRYDEAGVDLDSGDWDLCRHREREWREVADRLEAFGDDMAEVVRGVRSGEIVYTDRLEAPPEPRDPELRRVYAEWDRDADAWERPDLEEEDPDAERTL